MITPPFRGWRFTSSRDHRWILTRNYDMRLRLIISVRVNCEQAYPPGALNMVEETTIAPEIRSGH